MSKLPSPPSRAAIATHADTRRGFLRLAAAGAGFAVLGSALVACGGGGDAGFKVEESGGGTTPQGGGYLAALCDQATAASLTVRFTASDDGAPCGFLLQWMTFDDWWNAGYQWVGYCEAVYAQPLAAGESVDITVGASATPASQVAAGCDMALKCGEKYIFRALALADCVPVAKVGGEEPPAPRPDSDYTPVVFCFTLECAPPGDQCTYTIGYWRTHGPIPKGNNSNEWPVTSLMLGSNVYTDLQALAILQQPVRGNGLVNLAHQLIGAKLNVANGADGSAIATAIAQADFLIAGRVVPPVGDGYLAPRTVSDLVEALTAYNEGAAGPAHCG